MLPHPSNFAGRSFTKFSQPFPTHILVCLCPESTRANTEQLVVDSSEETMTAARIERK